MKTSRELGYQDGYDAGFDAFNEIIRGVKEELQRKYEMEDLEDRCSCGDADDDEASASTAASMANAIENAFRREFDPVITRFVICVNDEPYDDTFSKDPSTAWQLFLPILEADPSLGNEDVRLVKLVEE